MEFHYLQKSIELFIKRVVHFYANACGLTWDIFGPADKKHGCGMAILTLAVITHIPTLSLAMQSCTLIDLQTMAQM